MDNTVNLGLPSGTLWATCNVGAGRPEEYGLYFAWGETAPKTTYTEDNYTYTGGELILQNDAANAYMGGQWHMPTRSQIEELFAYTSSAWTEIIYYLGNGAKIAVTGATLTSSINGNTIFFPAAGHRVASKTFEEGKAFRVWSSEPYTYSPHGEPTSRVTLADYALYFFGKNKGGTFDNSGGNGSRYFGYSVRGVIG